jgi:hypothetical protein
MAIGCIVVTSYDNRIIAEDGAGTLYNLGLCPDSPEVIYEGDELTNV